MNWMREARMSLKNNWLKFMTLEEIVKLVKKAMHGSASALYMDGDHFHFRMPLQIQEQPGLL